MLHVSGGVIASLVILLLICFILPIAMFYALYRLAEGNAKHLFVGAAVYFVGGMILEYFVYRFVGMFTDMNENIPVYLIYTLVIIPALFIAANFIGIKFCGKDILTTGDSLMYCTGYASLQNMMSVGFISASYLLTLLDVKTTGNYVIVSDSEYASYSDMVSATNIVSETKFENLQNLCSTPASYFLTMCLDRLWVIAVYSAALLVLWLAVRKARSWPFIFVSFGMRVLISVPTIINGLGLISNKWITLTIVVLIAVIVWVIAVLCWKKLVDRNNLE